MADLEYNQIAKIKVVGIGGAGSNAVNRMVQEGVQGVEFYVAILTFRHLIFLLLPTRFSLARKALVQAEIRITDVRQQ